MAFPDERDRNLIRAADQVETLATDLCDWLSEFNPARKATELLPIAESDEFEVLQLRRLASSLYTSAKVPVAAAVYGPSQVGKSLFVGQVLQPHSENYCPIGGDETHGEPAYYKELSFDNDLNPQSGSNEATALVTRFTTKDRIAASVAPEYPVMVRALTRAEWLRVLARGFAVECQTPGHSWQKSNLESLFEELGMSFERRSIGRTELYQAQELFFCGTGCQVAPIVSVDHRSVGDGKPGRYTREVQDIFFDIVRGKNSRYMKWLREV